VHSVTYFSSVNDSIADKKSHDQKSNPLPKGYINENIMFFEEVDSLGLPTYINLRVKYSRNSLSYGQIDKDSIFLQYLFHTNHSHLLKSIVESHKLHMASDTTDINMDDNINQGGQFEDQVFCLGTKPIKAKHKENFWFGKRYGEKEPHQFYDDINEYYYKCKGQRKNEYIFKHYNADGKVREISIPLIFTYADVVARFKEIGLDSLLNGKHIVERPEY
jgi:hypothetical protein